jgi:hypothetical protein
MNKTLKLMLLKGGSFLMTIAPLAVVVGLNWSHYTQTTASTVSLSAGGGLAAIVFGLKAAGRLPKNMSSIIKYGIAFGIICLLEPLILDAKLLVGAALAGEIGDKVIFAYPIKRVQETIPMERAAKLNAETLGMLLENKGRV